MLEIQHLTKRYRKLLANDDVTFRVEDGEVAVLAGPNGAGKSTAIKSIAGLLRFEGTVLVCGHPNKSVEAKRCFGYIPEIPAPMESLTVLEHLEFIARAYRVGDWERKADALLERLELDDKRSKLGGELSKGMQQKLSICCALLPEPRVILLDEPLVGLDPHAIKELRDVIGELRARGCSVLISTHMLDTVRQVWDRALIMMSGKIAAERTRPEMEGNGESLEQLFFSITEGREENLGDDSVHSA
ncbi:ABC transporter ATP-binding protein [Caproiciproducens sp. NJN-50]|uniref:ABC transporter ATP-binding protein n=1 Tax=Acutalibacteraceae TaxID=3082771 RepID=UPI000FFE2DBF|nr:MULTISPECIES: ABC transporter ATP-binding protein [Acutalibacteraceae]QAT51159.1 ABC transporter ATP-binding protein [Caproiciproducens sp. NJN-50]